MRYAPLSDTAFGALPADAAMDADNLDAMDEVAELEIDGLDAAEAAMSPDGHWLAVTTADGTLYFFDAHRLMDTIWWQPAEGFYANPVFSPDGRDLAVTVQRQNRSQIQIFSNFDVVWLPTTRLDGHTDQMTAIDYQSDGWLVSGGLDGGLRQWESTAGYLPVMVDTDGPVTGVAAAPEDASGVLAGLEGGWVEYRLDDGDIPWSDLGALTAIPQPRGLVGFRRKRRGRPGRLRRRARWNGMSTTRKARIWLATCRRTTRTSRPRARPSAPTVRCW